jgi:hypothetical protein
MGDWFRDNNIIPFYDAYDKDSGDPVRVWLAPEDAVAFRLKFRL